MKYIIKHSYAALLQENNPQYKVTVQTQMLIIFQLRHVLIKRHIPFILQQ